MSEVQQFSEIQHCILYFPCLQSSLLIFVSEMPQFETAVLFFLQPQTALTDTKIIQLGARLFYHLNYFTFGQLSGFYIFTEHCMCWDSARIGPDSVCCIIKCWNVLEQATDCVRAEGALLASWHPKGYGNHIHACISSLLYLNVLKACRACVEKHSVLLYLLSTKQTCCSFSPSKCVQGEQAY